jgi:hypothetical protein
VRQCGAAGNAKFRAVAVSEQYYFLLKPNSSKGFKVVVDKFRKALNYIRWTQKIQNAKCGIDIFE